MSNLDYQTENNWYAPLAQTAAAPAETPKKKRLSTGWKVFLGALLVVALIAVSSIAFSSGQESPALPFPTPGQTLPETEEQLPDDWQEFFGSYFLPEEKSGRNEIRLPKAEQTPSFEMELQEVAEQELSLQELYQKCAPSIVAISGYVNGRNGYYWGTGIILSADGLILTNAHVVEECDSVYITLPDNSSAEAMLVGADSTSDIAILKVDASGLTPAEFGDSAALTVGEHVAAIGNPLGETFRVTLTDGIISAIDRGMSYNGHTMTLLQTNAAINEGNSGGALFNMYGQVIGVTNMKMMSSYSSIEGIGFAIPSATVRSVVNSLIRYGEVRGRTAVGITVGAIPDNLAGHYEIPSGLYVSAVTENTDAAAKGLKVGDIITHVNGEPARTTDDILNVKNALSVGDTITFTVWREGESFDVDVALVEYNDIY
ncbi:MAG: trypsin-like peptidase domain-containing protein [Oscillospiraceae bacterium]|nr:trypsin-like peptidase domain-containing protein [Oscillospiraceae bacterium]